MEISYIIRHEARNSGGSVYLFNDGKSSLWHAYGFSAYTVFNILRNKVKNFTPVFSEELYLPELTVEKEDLTLITKALGAPKNGKDLKLYSVDKAFNVESYHKWLHDLRGLELAEVAYTSPAGMHINKNEYVADITSSTGKKIRRFVDFILAFIAIIILSPFMLVIYLAIKLEDGGPAIFRQERVGLNGKSFDILKFRSMRMDAEKDGPQLSCSGGYDDPRLTKVGRFIRKHHLDELPQLWNVLRGDMTFIGHRPERRFFIEQIMDYDPRYFYLYQIRPGVTSYATLYNGYTDTMEKMLRRLDYDLYYLGHRSWKFDIKILFNTFCSITFGKVF